MMPRYERGWMEGSTQEVRSPETGAMVTRTQAFTYDPDAAKASATLATPGGPSYTTTYAHDDARQPTSTTDWRNKVSTTAYFASGAPSATTVGSGVASASWEWHADAMPKALRWRNGADQVVRSHAAMPYDDGGSATSITSSPKLRAASGRDASPALRGDWRRSAGAMACPRYGVPRCGVSRNVSRTRRYGMRRCGIVRDRHPL